MLPKIDCGRIVGARIVGKLHRTTIAEATMLA